MIEARHEDTGGVHHGKKHQRVSHDEGARVRVHGGARAHRALHAKKGQDETQHQAARVAHEYLGVAALIAKEIEEEEREKHADKPRHQKRISQMPTRGEIEEKARQGHERKGGGKPVNAIHQVDGVANEDHQHNSERHARGEGYPVNAEKAVKAVYVKPAHGKRAGGHHLHGEFPTRQEAEDIIDDAHEEDEGYGQHEIYTPAANDDNVTFGIDIRQSHEQRHQHAGEERQTAQARRGVAMYLAVARQVVKASSLAKAKYHGDGQEAARGAGQGCERYDKNRRGHARTS